MQLRNASAAFAALDALREKLPIAMQDIRRALAEVTLPGRFQVLPGRPQVVLTSRTTLKRRPRWPRISATAVTSRKRSPYSACCETRILLAWCARVAPRITRWHLATLPGPRGAAAEELFEVLSKENIKTQATKHPTVASALAAAKNEAAENDKIVVFGSFLTVAGAYG